MHLDPTTLTAIITAGGTVVSAFLGFMANKVHKSWTGVQEVREQVSNGHSTNLRADIDEILEGQKELLTGQAAHAARIEDLRVDLDWERRERMDLARIVHGTVPQARTSAEGPDPIIA